MLITGQMKKALREMQTLHAGCNKAEPNFFALLQAPFPGARDSQNLISWRWSLPLPTDPVWWGSMHAISSYRVNRPTNTRHLPARPLQTRPQTGPITIHCAAKLSAQCNYHIPWTCSPQAHLGVFQLCPWLLNASRYLGGGLPCLSSALWRQYPNVP